MFSDGRGSAVFPYSYLNDSGFHICQYRCPVLGGHRSIFQQSGRDTLQDTGTRWNIFAMPLGTQE